MPQEIKTTLDFKNVGKIVNLPDGVDAQDAATVHQLGAISGAVLPAGGTTGQIIKKQSNTDYDVDWEDAPLLAWGFGGDINNQTDLISGGKILSSLLPALAITDTFVVGSQVAMLALTAETGDIAVRTDETKTYILKGTDPSVLADWELLLTPTGGVVSVFGRSGAVTAQSGDYSFSQISGVVDALQGGAPAGGASGYVLTKNSATDYDYSWAAAAGGIPSMTGNNGKFLTTDGTVASWGAVTGWSTTGNSGTDPSINFIGTLDNKNLAFRINNANVALLTPTSFTFGDPSGSIYQQISATGFNFLNGGTSNKISFDTVHGNAFTFTGAFGLLTPIQASSAYISRIISSASSNAQFDISGINREGNRKAFTFTTSQGERLAIFDNYGASRANISMLTGNGALVIGTYTDYSSSILTLNSTTMGFLPPRQTTTQITSIASPAEALMVYDNVIHKYKFYNGSAWETITSV